MRAVHIEQIDLNLVPLLAALLEERHVSRAAERVNLTQPAMSRVLGRLRRVFDDDLLVRGPTGYQLTTRAEFLRIQIVELLPGLERLFTVATFDPVQAAQNFLLVGSDYAILTFGPALFRFVLDHSPSSSLRFENWNEGTFADIDAGNVDLAFHSPGGPSHLRNELLFNDRCVCLMSADHPLAAAHEIRLAEYLAWPHLIVSIDGGRQPSVDNPLAAIGTPRSAGLTLPSHTAAIVAVRGTRLIATIPERLLTAGLPAGTTAIRAPAQVEALPYSMIWSPRVDHDPAHTWLRNAVRATCQPPTNQ